MSVSSLRTQIIETQKIRSDLMKWKLVLVSGLGAAGIGLEKFNITQQIILLALIPLVCVYVDAMCAHLSLRILLIGEFIATYDPLNDDEKCAQSYECFIRQKPQSYGLEEFALRWSTIFLS